MNFLEFNKKFLTETACIKRFVQIINSPIKYSIYLLQIASDCNIVFWMPKKKILGNYQ